MKIGIVTYHRAYNFGAQLQAYALKTILSKMDNVVAFIDHDLLDIKIKFPTYPFKVLFSDRRPHAFIKHLMTYTYTYFFHTLRDYFHKIPEVKKKQRALFEQTGLYRLFAQTYLNLPKKSIASKRILQRSISDKDCIIYGSDQIWNPWQGQTLKEFYYGAQAPGIRKISYAASAGSLENIPESMRPQFLQLLHNFSALSCREEDLTAYIRAHGFECQTVLDPTLLLNAEDYAQIENKPECVSQKDFLFVYEIWHDDAVQEQPKRYAQQHNLEIVIIERNPRKDMGPREFLWLIHHAKTVITNSFHAVAFSLIFNKNFTAFKPVNGAARIETILENVNLMSRYYDAAQPYEVIDFSAQIDFAPVNEKMQFLREQSLTWLKNAIGENK